MGNPVVSRDGNDWGVVEEFSTMGMNDWSIERKKD